MDRIKDRSRKVEKMTAEQQAKFGTAFSNRQLLEEHFSDKAESITNHREAGITIKVKT